ncbi:MAG: DUF104 domain-containing protein [Desulfurococcales archaeon]|nr:DUF104 domain-containing protein [Desulfurococcales archaeon]
MSKAIRVKYENGVLKPLEPLGLEEGEEVIVVLKEDLVRYARRVRHSLAGRGEPSEVLSRERGRLGWRS